MHTTAVGIEKAEETADAKGKMVKQEMNVEADEKPVT